MRRPAALLGSLLFFWLAPGTVAGLIPWSLTGWRMGPPLLGLAAIRWLGAVVFAAGLGVTLECFWRFATRGLGTPSPVAPTEHLVVSGLYRFVRNPMYVGVLAMIVGQALWLGSPLLLGYAGLVWVAFTTFVLAFEEPTLRRTFGAEYEAYCARVPRWLPRLRR
jgi:protein-S-isoprenylcysteine O-methyltransferase Ste14